MPLFHYTDNYGQTGIVRDGFRVRTVAARMLPTVLSVAEASLGAMGWTLHVSWYTDQDIPNRADLGFLVGRTETDRTEHRFRVTDEHAIQSWREFKRTAPHALAAAVEDIPGASPDQWLVSVAPAVPVAYVALDDDDRATQALREQLWTPR